MVRRYMDYNATTPLSSFVKQHLVTCLEIFGNPSSIHYEGRIARKALQNARLAIAAFTGLQTENIYFTSGASEAAATLLNTEYKLGRTPLKLSHLYVGETEHPAILNGGNFPKDSVTKIKTDKNGLINQEILKKLLQEHDQTQGKPLVAIQAANNETGVLQPLKDLAKLIREYSGIFVVDIVQSLGKIPLVLDPSLGDFFIASAHKIGGLKGAGFFAGSQPLLAPEPLIKAGGQESGMRGGTQALLPILSFGLACSEIKDICEKEAERLTKLRDRLEHFLKENIDDVYIYGEKVPRLPNTTFFSIKNVKSETIQIALDLAGFSVSSGAACSSGKIGPNEVLLAMDKKNKDGGIRVSLGRANTEKDVDDFCNYLKHWIKTKDKGW